jgi:hypothetical protein
MSQAVLEKLEQAKQRVERANIRRNRIQVQLEAARQQHAEAMRAAEELVAERRKKGLHTDLLSAEREVGLPLLRDILAREEEENAAAVAEFVRAVDHFESFISRIEGALADPEAMAAVLATMAPVIAPEVTPAAPAPAKPAASAAVAFEEGDI